MKPITIMRYGKKNDLFGIYLFDDVVALEKTEYDIAIIIGLHVFGWWRYKRKFYYEHL